MLPAADFVTAHKIWGTFTSLLLLELLFLDKELMKTAARQRKFVTWRGAGYSLRRI